MIRSICCMMRLVERVLQLFVSVSISILNNCIENGVPVPNEGTKDGDCVWEYEILGLWSIGNISY